jgi:2-keto-4-pentenoate hydratase/2-oxohepta-3-ene-1,7-dioic acid hydratase in catechol pathway
MIALASSAMTLYPGDVFMSGAADVAPIEPGDTMVLEIPRIGRLEVPVRVSPHARRSA